MWKCFFEDVFVKSNDLDRSRHIWAYEYSESNDNDNSFATTSTASATTTTPTTSKRNDEQVTETFHVDHASSVNDGTF